MKRFLVFLAAIILGFSNLNANPRYVTANFLNMRTGPGTDYSIIGVLPQGTQVEVSEDCDCQWILIEWNGQIGFVSSRYLSDDPCTTTNGGGEQVKSPAYYPYVPAGATALCKDGTYSFSQHRRGTCSHHGGVAKWLR